ncbi:MAG: hypothetical protein ACREJU_20205 [Nitrospiraceae bacterium]
MAVWIQVAVMLLAVSSEAGQEEWLQGNRIKIRPGGFEGQSLITMEMGQGGDVWIKQDSKADDKLTTLSLLLVAGKAVAVTGGELPSGAEMEILDRAGLQLQLVEYILARAFPAGPDGVKGQKKMAMSEKKEPIRIGTTGAKGYFSPPWSVSGKATLLAPDKIGFDFTFSFAGEKAKKKRSTLKFAGIWQRDARTPQFDDRLPLEGWKIYLLGTRTGDKTAEYGAVPTESYKTLGHLREALQKQP